MAFKRAEGRKNDEMRPITAKVGVIDRADGSAYFKIGDTEAYAAVYGPRDLYPRFKKNPEQGLLRCNYNMMPFSGAGNRVRPGPSRRSKEISLVTEKALLPVVNLKDFPNAVVDVFVEFPQTDAGSRCAGICAAAMALADAGIEMKDLVAAVSAGKVENSYLVDLDYAEEAYEGQVTDMPIAMVPSTGEITLMQMDGQIKKEDIPKMIDMVKTACVKISEIQRQALKNKFAEVSKNE